MAEKKKNIDLFNDPVLLARQLAQSQGAAFRGQFLPEPANPIADVLHKHGLTLEGIRDGSTS